MKSNHSGKVLVVDDDKDVLFTAQLVLKRFFNRVDILDRPALIPEHLSKTGYDVILLDMNFSRGSTSGREGLEWLEKILTIDPGACVLTTTAYGEISLAVQTMKKGAADFIIKPWNKDQLVSSVRNVLDRKEQKSHPVLNTTETEIKNNRLSKYPDIISKSPGMKKVLETIRVVAPTDANVL